MIDQDDFVELLETVTEAMKKEDLKIHVKDLVEIHNGYESPLVTAIEDKFNSYYYHDLIITLWVEKSYRSNKAGTLLVYAV